MSSYSSRSSSASGDGESPPRYKAKENSEESRLHLLRRVVSELEISMATVDELRALEAYDIVFLCDDSGSMNELVTAPGEVRDVFAHRRTRWDELKETVETVMRLASALDTDGIDVYFLNRPGAGGVKDTRTLKNLFSAKPAGYTPLTKAVNTIIREKSSAEGKRLLLVIATDGEPFDGANGDSPEIFESCLMHRDADRICVSILACTDDEKDVGYLNRLDDKVKNCDVTDDYASERLQVLKAHPHARFTRGDYICKALLGAVSARWDQLDEKSSACCTIL